MTKHDRAEKLVEEMVVRMVEETAVAYKERVVTDRVCLHKRVHEDQEVLDIPVRTEALEVERVPVGRFVEAPPAIRQEGDTTVYPVVVKVLVVEKRLPGRGSARHPAAGDPACPGRDRTAARGGRCRARSGLRQRWARRQGLNPGRGAGPEAR